MNIAVTGSHGFIGSTLCRALAARGDVVVRLPRGEIDAAKLEGVDAVINLAGANIVGGLWTKRRRALIRESRVQGTWALCRTLTGLPRPPRVLISASAVGYYGDGFLSRVCREWEEATSPAAKCGIRVVNTRFGMVLGKNGGTLAMMLPLFKLGLGGKLGDGQQWMSWVHLDDVIGIILFAIDRDVLQGPVDVVSPNPVTNAEFTKTLGRILHRPTFCTVPAFALKAMGAMGRELFLTSTRTLPHQLQQVGYTFRYPTLESALRSV